MNSDANITGHLSTGPIVNVNKPSQVSLNFVYQYLVNHGWHVSYQCCLQHIQPGKKGSVAEG